MDVRQRLLQALGERLLYEYDATWECETYGEVYRDCPEAAMSEAVATLSCVARAEQRSG